MKPTIQAVLFDIGGVLLELDWDGAVQALDFDLSKLPGTLPQFIGSWKSYDAYERGHLSTQEFFTQLGKEFGHPGSVAELTAGWNKLIGGQVRGIEEILSSLSVPIFALSNTNEAHYEYFRERFPVFSRFEEIFKSYDLGMRKPEAEIYLKAAELMGVEPEAILFIDDVKRNVEAARELGFNAEQVQDPASELAGILAAYRY